MSFLAISCVGSLFGSVFPLPGKPLSQLFLASLVYLSALDVWAVPVVVPDCASVAVDAEHAIDRAVPREVDSVVSIKGVDIGGDSS